MTGRVVNWFFELGTLRKIARSHRQTLLTDDLSDNIASHSFRTTMIGWCLAEAEKADTAKVVFMCLLHDTAETRTGDQNWVHKNYVHTEEEGAAAGQLLKLPGEVFMKDIGREYRARKSKEARLAKDADLLDQVLLLSEYAWRGNRETREWLNGNEQMKRLSSQTAKKWCREICRQRPSEWWDKLWTADPAPADTK